MQDERFIRLERHNALPGFWHLTGAMIFFLFHVGKMRSAILLNLFYAGLVHSVEIDIVTLGILQPTEVLALALKLPAYELAVETANERYNGSLHLNFKAVYESSIEKCTDYLDNADRLLSRWYYRERRPWQQVVSVIAISGENRAKKSDKSS